MIRVIRDLIEAADLREHDYVHDPLVPGHVRAVTPTRTGSVRVVLRHASGTDIVTPHPPDRKLDVSRVVGVPPAGTRRRGHLRLVSERT